MRLVSFTAETPAAALVQIQKQLGPDAVVLAVRPVAATGLARFWPRRRGVEVLAGVAEEGDSQAAVPARSGLEANPGSVDWERCRHTELLRAGTARGPVAPPLYDATSRPHVFIGPPGVGKTSLLCKWLVTAVLSEARVARVWRLDGPTANTAELLNVYGEMFGLTVERFWQPSQTEPALSQPRAPIDFELEKEMETTPRLLLIDLPGVEAGDAQALRAAKEQLATLPNPRLHLVLNAAYEIPNLLEQFRAFAPFQPEDLSFTHLDEEKRQEKLLGFAAGTNCPVRFLSGGQKIPGQFTQVTGPHSA